MNKKVWIGFAAVFVVLAVLDAIIHGMLLQSAYEETKELWRPEAEMKMWIFYVVNLFVAYFMSLIFSKGYEGKGLLEGIRYGFYVGMLMSVPMAYGTYGVMDIPYSLALQWFIYGLIEFIIAGAVLALVYGKQAMVMRASAS